MQAELPALKQRISDVVSKSAVGKHLRDVTLEADRDDEGSDFLRIILEMNTLEGLRDEDIEALVQSIEDAVSDLDERFPSVRFSEAA